MKRATTFVLTFCFALALSWPTAAVAGSSPQPDRQKQQQKVWNDYNKSLQRQQKQQAKQQKRQLKQWRKQHPTTTTVT